jgi:hypothetical protein
LIADIRKQKPGLFTFSKNADGFVDVRDFGTTGVVAFAEGKPFTKLKTGVHDIGGRETQISAEYLTHCREASKEWLISCEI